MNVLINTQMGHFFYLQRNWLFPLLFCILLAMFPEKTMVSLYILYISIFCIFLGHFIRIIVMATSNIIRNGKCGIVAYELFTGGAYHLCRNPLYVGNMLIYFGMFLLYGNLYLLIIGTVLWLYIYHNIIVAEEDYLTKEFNGSYLGFLKDRNRWLINVFNIKKVFVGTKFNIFLGIYKDYNVIATTLLTIIVMGGYKNFLLNNRQIGIYLIESLLYLISVGFIVLCIALFKSKARKKAKAK